MTRQATTTRYIFEKPYYSTINILVDSIYSVTEKVMFLYVIKKYFVIWTQPIASEIAAFKKHSRKKGCSFIISVYIILIVYCALRIKSTHIHVSFHVQL